MLQEKLRKTIVFVTHDIHEAIKMGDRIAIFQDGRLVQYDSPGQTLTRPANRYIEDFVGTDRALKLLGLLRAEEAMDGSPGNIVEGSTSTGEALRFIEDKDSLNLIVIHQGKPMGYLYSKVLKGKDTEVKNVAEPYPVLIKVNDTLRDVMSQMLLHNVTLLPVVDENGDLAGSIDYQDIRKYIQGIYADNTEHE